MSDPGGFKSVLRKLLGKANSSSIDDDVPLQYREHVGGIAFTVVCVSTILIVAILNEAVVPVGSGQ